MFKNTSANKNQSSFEDSSNASIPKGDGYYARAKRAHILDKNLEKAEALYRAAIKSGDKMRSAIKDLSNVLHQKGRTEEACQLLESNKHLFKRDIQKIENLLLNLRKQIVPTGNFLNKTLVLFNVPSNFDEDKIKGLFENTTRIDSIQFTQDSGVDKILNGYEPLKDHFFEKPVAYIKRACLLNFSSNSAARKTLDTLLENTSYQFYWLNTNGKLVRKAEPFRRNQEEKTSTSFDSGNSSDSFEDCVNDNTICWSNFVFPLIEENRNNLSWIPNGSYKNSTISWTWNQVALKQYETQSMISEDPNFVNKLLNKVIFEQTMLQGFA